MEFAKDDLGKGEALEVDKSKDAMSTSSWGSVDKTSLRNKILNASNYKSLVNDVYMQVESGWEDAPSQHLKYPVMQLKGSTLVYNRGGLSSALGYAQANNESGVVSKVNAIYKHLGLDEKEEAAFADGDYLPYSIEENFKKEEDMTPEEEKKAKEEEKLKEEQKAKEEADKKKKMSNSEYMDVSALLAFLKSETESYRSVADDGNDSEPDGDDDDISACMAELEKEDMSAMNMNAVMSGMFSAMKKMSAKMGKFKSDNDTYMAKNEELSKFKQNVESERMQYEVEGVLKEAFDAGLPKDQVEECRAEASKYSFENIDAYKNMVKAKAFAYMGDKTTKKNDLHLIPLPFNIKKPATTSLWDK